MQRSSWGLLLVSAFLGLGPLVAVASAPTQVTYSDNNVVIPFYGYSDSGDCTTSCLKFGSGLTNGFHDAATYSSTWANYTNFAFGAATNAAQSFALGVSKSSDSLNAIASDHIEVVETFSSGSPILHVQSKSSIVSLVYTQGSYEGVVASAQFGSVAGCGSPPCVYYNAGNSTYLIYSNSVSPVTLDLYYIPFGNGKSCNIPGFPQSCSGGVTTTQTSTTAAAGGGGGFFTTTVVNGQTTTVPLASSTGNPALIPLGSALLGFVFFLVFIPPYLERRKRRGTTYHVGPPKEPRVTLSSSGNSRRPSGGRSGSRLSVRRRKEPRRKSGDRY